MFLLVVSSIVAILSLCSFSFFFFFYCWEEISSWPANHHQRETSDEISRKAIERECVTAAEINNDSIPFSSALASDPRRWCYRLSSSSSSHFRIRSFVALYCTSSPHEQFQSTYWPTDEQKYDRKKERKKERKKRWTRLHFASLDRCRNTVRHCQWNTRRSCWHEDDKLERDEEKEPSRSLVNNNDSISLRYQ
jgi:hypothetical protein